MQLTLMGMMDCDFGKAEPFRMEVQRLEPQHKMAGIWNIEGKH